MTDGEDRPPRDGAAAPNVLWIFGDQHRHGAAVADIDEFDVFQRPAGFRRDYQPCALRQA